MKPILFSFLGAFALFSISTHKLQAECCGKVDLGPAYVHLDVLESGHTVKRMDLVGARADGNWLAWKGVCLKPSVMYVTGNGELLTAGLGIGHYTPITEKFSLTPSIGCTYTELKTKINLRHLNLLNLKEYFQSASPYLSLEATYCFAKGWRGSFIYQYAYSSTRTVIKHLTKDRSHSWGPNYAIQLEKDLNDKWSVNIGAAYNISLSKEKHGLRGYGGRIAFAYWF